MLSRPGALRFSAAGLVGRLPLSMAGLGMLLLVQADTGSYGVGGSVSAVYMVANAVAALPLGRLVDARGQGRVLALGSLVFGAALVALVVTVQTGWPLWSSYVAAAVAGATLPPIDACVRTRWAHVLDRPDEVETAYAFEAVVDESVFMVGPILVTLLATLVHPVAGIAATVVAGVGGSLAFAAQRGTEPPAHPHDRAAGARVPLPWRALAPLTVVCVALGLMFGAAEVITVAFADEHGHKSVSGVLLALWALGSLVAGVVTGTLTFRRGPHRAGPLGRPRAGRGHGTADADRLDRPDGGVHAGRRVRHRPDPDRHHGDDRAGHPGRPADRGDGAAADRAGRRDRAGRSAGRHRGRPLRRLAGLPRPAGRRDPGGRGCAGAAVESRRQGLGDGRASSPSLRGPCRSSPPTVASSRRPVRCCSPRPGWWVGCRSRWSTIGIVLLVQSGTGSYGARRGGRRDLHGRHAILRDRAGTVHRRLGPAAGADGAGDRLRAGQPPSWSWPSRRTGRAGSPTSPRRWPARAPQRRRCVRTRWTHVLDARPRCRRPSRWSRRSTRCVFMSARSWSRCWPPWSTRSLGVAAAAAAGTARQPRFAAQRRTEPPPTRTTAARGSGPRCPGAPCCRSRRLRRRSASCSARPRWPRSRSPTSATTRARRPLLALWALGSLMAGLVTGAIAWQRPTSFRVRVGAVGMACAMPRSA